MPHARAGEIGAGEIRERLRGFDNPFDDYVEGRQVNRAFRHRHVPEVNQRAYGVLEGTLARYHASARDAGADDLLRSGILTVYGPRGSGKTHLLHAAQAGLDTMVVAPTHYDPRRRFKEYLLHQLVLSLQEDADGESGTLQSVAEWFSKTALMCALEGMTETKWLAHSAASRLAFWRRRLGAGDPETSPSAEGLLEGLRKDPEQALCEIIDYEGQDPDVVRRILHRHIDDCERGREPGAQIQRALFHRLVDCALDDSSDAVFDYLVDEFTQVEAQLPPSRETLVEGLFEALVRLLLLAGRPVLFAFDALEALLGDPPDPELCQVFANNIANVRDDHRGVQYVVLAESRYFTAILDRAGEYALHRFEEGVPTTLKAGSVDRIELRAPRLVDVEAIVMRRMAPVLAEVFGGDVPAGAMLQPFTSSDVATIARKDDPDPPPLRQILQALRKRYHALVFTRESTAATPADRVPVVAPPAETQEASAGEVLVREAWDRHVRLARRLVESATPSSYADDLLKGFEGWIREYVGQGLPGSDVHFKDAEIVLFGDHPTYGQLVRCLWERPEGPIRRGIGFLLGLKRGTSRDLETKLEMMTSKTPLVDHVRILWPRARRVGMVASSSLPRATREVWDRYMSSSLEGRVTLEVVDFDALAAWLAYTDWRKEMRDAHPPVEQAEREQFIRTRTGPLWALVTEEGEDA